MFSTLPLRVKFSLELMIHRYPVMLPQPSPAAVGMERLREIKWLKGRTYPDSLNIMTQNTVPAGSTQLRGMQNEAILGHSSPFPSHLVKTADSPTLSLPPVLAHIAAEMERNALINDNKATVNRKLENYLFYRCKDKDGNMGFPRYKGDIISPNSRNFSGEHGIATLREHCEIALKNLVTEHVAKTDLPPDPTTTPKIKEFSMKNMRKKVEKVLTGKDLVNSKMHQFFVLGNGPAGALQVPGVKGEEDEIIFYYKIGIKDYMELDGLEANFEGVVAMGDSDSEWVVKSEIMEGGEVIGEKERVYEMVL